MAVTVDDVRLFLGKRIKLNIKVNGLDRYYSEGAILKINDDSFVFKDKFGALVSVSFDAVVKLEEKLIFKNGEVVKEDENFIERREGDWKEEV